MAVHIESKPSLKYLKDIFTLPFDINKPNEGYLLIPLIKDVSNFIPMIAENLLVSNVFKYQKLFRPMRYNDKIFNSQIKYKLGSDEVIELTALAKNMKLQFSDKVSSIKKKNTIMDTSILHKNFIQYSASKNYILICKSYIEHLVYYIDTVCKGFEQEHRYLLINSATWDISYENKAKVISLNSKLINPITMFYTLSKKEPELLKKLEKYTFIIEDGDHGWIWFNGNEIQDDDFFNKFKNLLSKFKKAVPLHESDDDLEDENKKHALSSDIGKSMEEELDDENEADDLNTDIDPGDNNIDKDEEEELLRMQEEIELNFKESSRSMPNNKRLEELRKKQMKVKLDGLSFDDIGKNEHVDKSIEVTDISDKIFSPNENAKKIRFDNFNKSYNKTLKDRDIMSIFKSFNTKSSPVFVTKIERKDSSTPMDLKETWTVTLEGEDHSRHTLTFDLPIFYEENYIYIGGNRKEFVNQQFMLPIVKTAPDTVQLCSNYNKIFMKRYGDENISPEVQLFQKIVLAHPEEFNVTVGNGTALSKGHKTSIEYDSLAKKFLSIEIKKDKDKAKLLFDQSYYDEQVAQKKLDALDPDWIYCLLVEEGFAIPCNIEEDMSAFNESDVEDYHHNDRNKPERPDSSIINIFTTYYRDTTGKDFWSLEPDLKPGKRFMYSRCTVMAKKIPTVLFLSYFEGLSTVMRKAGVESTFTDKRPVVDHKQKAVLQFSDGYLIYDRYPTKISMLMNGMSIVDTKAYKYSDFDEKNVYLDIFDELYGSRMLASALDAFYDNFIDPVTMEILQDLDLPTDFVSFVLVGNNLLCDNNFVSEISTENYRVRSNEMVYAYAYKTIANAYSRYKRSVNNKTPVKISIPKNEVIKEIITSNIMEDVSIINPITEKEKQRSMVAKGPSGVNVDRAYTKEKRCFDDSMSGFSAMSTSPDANCGVVREMTIEPKIMNTRGMIDNKKSLKEMKDTNLFSYAELLTPLSVINDDQIRVIAI